MDYSKLYYKNWPENVPKNLNFREVSLDTVLRETAKSFPESIATTYFGAQINYATLDLLVDICGTIFTEKGIKKGDTVGLYFTNCPPIVAAYYGALRIGARVTLISPLFQALELKYQLNDSECKLLVAWEGFEDMALKIIPETGVKTFLLSSMAPWTTGDPRQAEPISPDGSKLYLEDLIIKTKPNISAVKLDVKKDVAVLQYTGGTTGLPKGAMLSHWNLVCNVEQMISWFPGCELGKEVMMMALPIYHVYAQTVGMNFSIRMGANMVMCFNPREVEDLIELIETYKVTIFPGVAALYNLMNNYPDIEKKHLHSLKFCLSGAGPLPLEIQTKFEKLTGAKLREGFGLTEAGPITHANPLYGKSKSGTVGLPFPDTEMKIVDIETGTKELGVNEVGELCVKGPQIMLGYYKKDAENKRTLRDGWLYTGDLAAIDEEGYTAIKDRLKNMIKYKGHSVYPAEVEALFMEHQAIFECAVIGIPDTVVGEYIKAFIVLKPDFKGKIIEKDLMEWAKKNMSAFKVPKEIQFLDEIPKTNTGKILHRLLREGKFET